MREFALTQTAILLRRLAFQVRAATDGSTDKVHDLRVAIRRFNRCLRVFAQFYPDHSAKRVRQRLSRLMEAAGAVRDCDIALQLLAEAGISPPEPLAVQLEEDRRQAGLKLQRELRRFRSSNFSRKWRTGLELKP